jgi:hypothetical protein
MSLVADYRCRAQEWLDMANTAKPSERKTFIEFAATCVHLAEFAALMENAKDANHRAKQKIRH